VSTNANNAITIPKIPVVWSTLIATIFGTGGIVGLILTALHTGNLKLVPSIAVAASSVVSAAIAAWHSMSVVAHKTKTQNAAKAGSRS
jgi:hypothetical protein